MLCPILLLIRSLQFVSLNLHYKIKDAPGSDELGVHTMDPVVYIVYEVSAIVYVIRTEGSLFDADSHFFPK